MYKQVVALSESNADQSLRHFVLVWVYPNIRYIPNLQFWWESIFRQIHFVLGFKILMFQILKPTMHHRIAISHPCKTAIRLKLFQIPISISDSHGKLGIYFFSKFQISPTIYVNPIKLPTGKWHFDSHGGIPSLLQDYAVRQQSYLSFAKESRVGHSAIRSADVEASLENSTILQFPSWL